MQPILAAIETIAAHCDACGWDRLGMMHEAKGEKKAAADCYRKALQIIHAHVELYDPEFVEVFVELIDRLDPPNTAPTT